MQITMNRDIYMVDSSTCFTHENEGGFYIQQNQSFVSQISSFSMICIPGPSPIATVAKPREHSLLVAMNAAIPQWCLGV